MKRMKHFFQIIKSNPKQLVISGITKIMAMPILRDLLSSKMCIRIRYRLKLGKKLNLENPRTFNEKLQWLKLYDKNPLYIQLADKYEVRQYVKEKIGEQYLVPLIGIYKDENEIPFDNLPEQYVLKCTHDSGTVIIMNEQNNITTDEMKLILRRSLKRNFYYLGREWPYKNILPRIICESVIQTVDNCPPRDYKIFCFDGEPKFAFVASDRGRGTKFDFFDLAWNKYPFTQHYPNSNYDIPKPKQWDEMLFLAGKLSKGIPHVRVDFYIDVNEKILFGELTFSHFSGMEKFEPEEYDEYFGRFITLPGRER